VLEQGLAATGDAEIAELLSSLRGGEMQNSQMSAIDIAGRPAELWVVTQQFVEAYYVSPNYSYTAYHISRYEYDELGYVIRDEFTSYYSDSDENDVSVRTHEYDRAEDGRVFSSSYLGGEPMLVSDSTGLPFTPDMFISTIIGAYSAVWASPFPHSTHTWASIDDKGRADNLEYDNYDFKPWHHAQYQFDENGNPSRVDSFAEDGTLQGYCEFTWEKLVLTADGTYIMEG